MFLTIILLILGFILLIKGADIFVDGASSLAENFKVPKMIIALTIVAFGTSAPELAVSTQAILKGSSEIVLGNVVGSNILNILLILGVSSLFSKIYVKDDTVHKEIPFTILFSILLTVICFDNILDKSALNIISRNDGIIILLFFMIFIYYLINSMKKNKKKDEVVKPKFNILTSILLLVLGLVGIVAGSNFVVESASKIARFLGVSDKLISLTIVALGTSLPELVTSVEASRKGENDIAIGNVIGSNIFNIGVVIGLPVTVINTINVGTFNYIDMFMMVFSALLLYILTRKDKQIGKKNGIMMLLMFIIYYMYVLLGGLK
ncbi:MAG: calcium/sodium antiporter [Bacilli bacterium]|nr:calcium/sodium antiporter [Bacilli bacterium]